MKQDQNKFQPSEEQQSAATRVADLDASDKPREKAINIGISSLSNAELMAIIFGSGLPGKSVIELSRDILREHDNRLSHVARMSIHELVRRYSGIGPAKAVTLAAAFELGRRCQADETIADPQIRESRDIYARYRHRLSLLNYEEFIVVHLSRSNRIIYDDVVSKGGTASTLVDVKLVMKQAVDKLSSALVFIHNHPSGNLQPSRQDDELTQKLKRAAELIDVRVVDHIIISPQGYYSYADQGRL